MKSLAHSHIHTRYHRRYFKAQRVMGHILFLLLIFVTFIIPEKDANPIASPGIINDKLRRMNSRFTFGRWGKYLREEVEETLGKKESSGAGVSESKATPAPAPNSVVLGIDMDLIYGNDLPTTTTTTSTTRPPEPDGPEMNLFNSIVSPEPVLPQPKCGLNLQCESCHNGQAELTSLQQKKVQPLFPGIKSYNHDFKRKHPVGELITHLDDGCQRGLQCVVGFFEDSKLLGYICKPRDGPGVGEHKSDSNRFHGGSSSGIRRARSGAGATAAIEMKPYIFTLIVTLITNNLIFFIDILLK